MLSFLMQNYLKNFRVLKFFLVFLLVLSLTTRNLSHVSVICFPFSLNLNVSTLDYTRLNGIDIITLYTIFVFIIQLNIILSFKTGYQSNYHVLLAFKLINSIALFLYIKKMTTSVVKCLLADNEYSFYSLNTRILTFIENRIADKRCSV